MISTITANRLSYLPCVKSTTRPTSTNLHCEATISISVIVAIMSGTARSAYYFQPNFIGVGHLTCDGFNTKDSLSIALCQNLVVAVRGNVRLIEATLALL